MQVQTGSINQVPLQMCDWVSIEWATETGSDADAGTVDCTETWGFTAAQGWNGDDYSIDNSSTGVAATYIDLVTADTLPAAIDSVTIAALFLGSTPNSSRSAVTLPGPKQRLSRPLARWSRKASRPATAC